MQHITCHPYKRNETSVWHNYVSFFGGQFFSTIRFSKFFPMSQSMNILRHLLTSQSMHEAAELWPLLIFMWTGGGSSRIIVVLSVTIGKIEVRFWHDNDKHRHVTWHVIRYKIFIKLSTVSTQIFVTPPDGSLYRVGGESECLLFQSSLGSSQVS